MEKQLAAQHKEQRAVQDANIQNAIDRVIEARKKLDENTAFLDECRKNREDSKAKYMHVVKALCGEFKAIYGQHCDTVRTMENVVRGSQSYLTSAIDSLDHRRQRLPVLRPALMDSLLDGLPAERRRNKMLNASTIRGTFKQIPYWKLRGRFHSCRFRDQEIANAIGIGTDIMSKRMNGKQPWTSTRDRRNLQDARYPQDEIGELFLPTVEERRNPHENQIRRMVLAGNGLLGGGPAVPAWGLRAASRPAAPSPDGAFITAMVLILLASSSCRRALQPSA